MDLPATLFVITAFLLLGAFVAVVFFSWREWSRVLQGMALGSAALLGCLFALTAFELGDKEFRAAVLANYVVAVGLFIFTFFAVDRFFEMKRTRAVFESYLPALEEELTLSCCSLARSLALVRLAREEGCEVLGEIGVPTVSYREVALVSLLNSGHFSSLPTGRDSYHKVPAEVLKRVSTILGEQINLEGEADYVELVGWSTGFSGDVTRGYELAQTTKTLFAAAELGLVTAQMVASQTPATTHNPDTPEQARFAAAIGNAKVFCRAASATLVFCCFVLSEIASCERRRSRKYNGRRESFEDRLRGVAGRVISTVPVRLRVRSARA
jgi:hypothetical protein